MLQVLEPGKHLGCSTQELLVDLCVLGVNVTNWEPWLGHVVSCMMVAQGLTATLLSRMLCSLLCCALLSTVLLETFLPHLLFLDAACG